MEEMRYAPIVLFAYARPEHTRRTLEALSRNSLAQQSTLFIYVDGVKREAPDDLRKRNNEVKKVVLEQKWCGEVHVVERDENFGLARSIREGVTEILNRFKKIIVLEDDIVTSLAFLSYMNKALDFYERFPAVFSIGGYTYPPRQMSIPADYEYDTYACLRNCSWGWATWQNRWQLVDWDATMYQGLKNIPAMKNALNRMGDDEFKLCQAYMENNLNIWSVLFTMSHFVNHAVAIIPCQSYVENIGLDGSGENCGKQEALHYSNLCMNDNPRFLDVIYEDSRIINAFYNVNCVQKLPMWKRIINRLSRMFKGGKVFYKVKVYV